MHSVFPYLFRKSGAGTFLRQDKREQITVLCFHRVTDEVNHVWPSMPVKVFIEIIKYCKKNYEVILPSAWSEKTQRPKLIITFDDGFHDFMEYAVPVLFEHNLPAVHHVVISSVLNNKPNWTYSLNLVVEDHLKSGKKISVTEPGVTYDAYVTLKNASQRALEFLLLLKDLPLSHTEAILSKLEKECEGDLYFPKMMNTTDLKQCGEAGIEIGSHGWTHTLLNGSLNESILEREVVESKITLEKILEHRVQCFAFPAGIFDEKVLALSKKGGYDYIFLAENRFFTMQESKNVPVVFPRIIPPNRNADLAILKIEGFHSRFKKRQLA